MTQQLRRIGESNSFDLSFVRGNLADRLGDKIQVTLGVNPPRKPDKDSSRLDAPFFQLTDRDVRTLPNQSRWIEFLLPGKAQWIAPDLEIHLPM
jgi:hypothetical protein